jgi:hypothetical protein
MKREQQHKMVLSLRERQNVMSGEDREAFAMMLKRDKDDEELDSITLRELNRMLEQYVKRRSREDLESRWKKLGGT